MLYNPKLVHRLISIPDECPKSPIFALFTPLPRDLAQYCQQLGFVVRGVVPPTVPEGTERVRVCLHAGNTENQVDSFVEAVGRWIDWKSENPAKQPGVVEKAKL